MKLPLRYYNDPILRQKAQEVTEITDEVKQLVQDMIDTVLSYEAIGIAANQVGSLLRIFIGLVDYETEEGELHIEDPPTVYINPKLSSPSEEKITLNEGCLSIPDFRGAVSRPESIIVEALDIEGRPFKRELHGYAARLVMHENDHLNGVLFIDRMSKASRKEAEPFLREVNKKYH